MNWIDTHAHIYFEDMDNSLDHIMEASFVQNVNTIILPSIDAQSTKAIQTTIQHFPKNCYAMIGLHPCYVNKEYTAELDQLYKTLIANANDYIAVGEIGLDFYHDKTFMEEQKKAFSTQLAWANEMQLPIAIHSRDAHADTWDIIKSDFKICKGIFHCFSGDYALAKEVVDMGMHLGIGGAFTYPKNEQLREVVKTIGLEGIVLETDAPYLTPVPFRKEKNHPKYIPVIGQAIADVLQVSIEEVASITTANAKKIFNIA